MKKIRIYALPSHQTKERTSGVDYARIIQPMKALNGYKDDEVGFQIDIYDIHAVKEADWLNISENYDIIYLNYIANPWSFAAMGAMARKNGVKIILDVDDALWNIRSDNPAGNFYKRGSQEIRNFTAICNEVDYITTTNSYLKHVIMNNTTKTADKIVLFPNYIDLDFYSHRSPFKDTNEIQLMHYGSTTHFIDLNDTEFTKGVDRIMKEYPQVVFRSIGAFIPKFRTMWGARYQQVYGHQDIVHWVKDEDKFAQFMDQSDIIVVPLEEDIYNKSKSGIKYLEASSAKKPGVYQKIRQYSELIVDGENGFLANKANEWYHAIKDLIDDKERRQRTGEEAFKTIEAEHQLKDHLKDYAHFFKKLLQEDQSAKVA